MIETAEDRADILAEAGIDAEFLNGTIKVILGTDTVYLRQEPSFAFVEKPEINLYADQGDALSVEVANKQEVIITDDHYSYTLATVNNPLPYFDGWVRIPVVFKFKELL